MSAFYNREEEIQRLLGLAHRLTEGTAENLALMGVRKVGKTLLLFHLEERLAHSPDLIFVYTYVEPGLFRDFAVASLLALLSQTVSHFQSLDKTRFLGLSTQEKLQSFAKLLLPLFPSLSSQWLELPLLLSKEPEVVLDMTFQLTEQLGQARDLYFILAFDEFQNIRTFNVPALEHKLRQHLLRQKRFAVIAAGSSISLIEDLFRNRRNPLFGHFRIELVQPFSFATARGFILHKLKGKLLLNETQLAFLTQITGGYPYYLDVLTDEILQRSAALKRARQMVLSEAIVSSVFASNGLLYTYLSYLIEASFQERGYKSYVNLLRAVAVGKHAVSEIARQLRLKQENISTPLRRLTDMGFLHREHSKYFFNDPLLELWIREAYGVGQELDVLGVRERYRLFKSQVEQMLASFKAELGKGNEARVRELFAAFDGRTAMHGTRLPRFEQVTAGVVEGEEYDVIAHLRGRKAWIAEVKDTPVDTAMLVAFAQKIKRLTTLKPEKMILIALAGYDRQVPAVADKAGVTLWSQDELESLCRTYGKYPIRL